MIQLVMFFLKRILPFFLLSLFLDSCYYDNQEELHPKISATKCDTTATISYLNDVVPILKTNCGINNSCHNGTSVFFAMDTYDGVVVQATSGKLVKSIKHDPSLAAVDWMPSGGGKLDDCSIMKIEAWVNRGSPNN